MSAHTGWSALVDGRGVGRPHGLVFGPPDDEARAIIAGLSDDDLGGGRPVRDRDALAAVRAALYVLFDCESEAHAIVQDLDTVSGSFWHAVVHRREPDPGNARYWLARVGRHPVYATLLEEARAIVGDDRDPELRRLVDAAAWDPARFVALATSEAPAARARLLRAIERREWELFFAADLARAF